MRVEIIFFIILATVFANASSEVDSTKEQERLLLSPSSLSFTTFTLIKKTTVITSTFTATTSCTTFDGALPTCSSMRRRRNIPHNNFAAQGRMRRSLFYNDFEVENKDGTVFLPVQNNNSDPSKEVAKTSTDESSLIPLEIDSGFTLPEGSPNRFLLAFGTSTITSVVVTTSTSTLLAICASTTDFPLCGHTGK